MGCDIDRVPTHREPSWSADACKAQHMAEDFNDAYPTCAETYVGLTALSNGQEPTSASEALGVDPTEHWRRGDLRHGVARAATVGNCRASSESTLATLDATSSGFSTNSRSRTV